MAPKLSKSNSEIDYSVSMSNTSVTGTEKGKEATYGSKSVYGGMKTMDFGSETVHEVDYHKG